MSGTVLISGGGRGIGRAVALEFAAEEWSVAVMARSEEQLRETVTLVDEGCTVDFILSAPGIMDELADDFEAWWQSFVPIGEAAP